MVKKLSIPLITNFITFPAKKDIAYFKFKEQFEFPAKINCSHTLSDGLRTFYSMAKKIYHFSCKKKTLPIDDHISATA